MKYIVNRVFNSFLFGQELVAEVVKESWVNDGLVLAVEDKESFIAKVDETIEALDPEKKPKSKKG